MSDLDLTEAVAAEASFQYGVDYGAAWADEPDAQVREAYRFEAEQAVNRVAPLIVAQVRAQVAADLLSHINENHTPQWNNAMDVAVQVARGDVS